ncbi:MAG: RecB family exonuclease, partial [Cellulomonadaceae bacterium]
AADPAVVRAARLLARLAAHGVGPADPETWYYGGQVTSSAPVWREDQQVPVSPSRLETVSTCALRWALEAGGGTAAEAFSQSLGTLVHEIAQELPEGTREQLRARLDQRWPELGLHEGWVARTLRVRAEAMMTRLAQHVAASGPVLAVEEPFRLEIGRAVLAGSIDRVVRDGDRVQVEDLKTGKVIASREAAEVNPQLGAYQLAVDAGALEQCAGHAVSGGARLVYLDAGSRGPTQRTQEALDRAQDPTWVADLVARAATTMSGARFEARVNALCDRCPVRRSCPLQAEGRAVGGAACPTQEENR